MSSNPKIIVLKLREIIYTIVLLFLVAVFVLCLILMFGKKTNAPASEYTPSTSNTDAASEAYVPGIYTAPLSLGESAVDVEVTVDKNQIRSIRLVHLNDAVTASYPLINSSLDHIAAQILEKQSLSEITTPRENRHTAQLLFSAISQALSLAKTESILSYY